MSHPILPGVLKCLHGVALHSCPLCLMPADDPGGVQDAVAPLYNRIAALERLAAHDRDYIERLEAQQSALEAKLATAERDHAAYRETAEEIHRAYLVAHSERHAWRERAKRWKAAAKSNRAHADGLRGIQNEAVEILQAKLAAAERERDDFSDANATLLRECRKAEADLARERARAERMRERLQECLYLCDEDISVAELADAIRVIARAALSE